MITLLLSYPDVFYLKCYITTLEEKEVQTDEIIVLLKLATS